MDRTIRDVLVVAAIGGGVYLVAPALVHENVNPIVGGICSLATPDAWQRMMCELDVVKPAQPTYNWKPGVKCTWLAADREYPIKGALATAPDGSYVLQFGNDGHANVAANGDAQMFDGTGNVEHSGTCERVGGL